MLKNFICCLSVLSLLGITFPTTTAFAADIVVPIVSEEENVSVDEIPFDFSEPIRVGYYSAFHDVISDIDSQNNKGYGYEVFQKMAEIGGFEFEFVPIEDSMIEAVSSGYVDVGGFNTRNDERREQVLFSEMPFSKTYLALMSEDMDIAYADAAAIDGRTVSVYDENVGVETLDLFCEENNITVDYVYGETDEYMAQETDFYITYSEDPSSHNLNNVLNLGVYNLYLISSFENAPLMEELDAIYRDVVFTEGNFFMELEERYLASNIETNHRGLTNEEIEILRQRPLEVGYVTGFSPISYRNEQGEPDGAMVDILNNFSELYGFEVNYSPYSLEEPSEEHENFDILLTLYGDGVHEHEHYMPLDTFYHMPMYGVINRSLTSTVVRQELIASSPKIGSLPYQTVDFDSFFGHYPDTEIVYYTNWHELLDDLAAGNVDMLLCTESATTYAELYFEDVPTSTINLDVDIPMQLLINHEIADVYGPIFNVIVDRFSEREYTSIIETNTNDGLPSTNTGFWEFFKDNWYYFVIAFFLTAAGFIALYTHGKIKKKEALLQSYRIDQLTGLMAIQSFKKTVDEKMTTARAGEYELVSFDIDMFKTINTHFSTERGTEIIVSISDALKKAFEDTDVAICRRLADQFLFFRRVDDGGSMQQIYNNYILPNIHEHITEKYKVSLSFGNVIVENIKENGNALIGQADSARIVGKATHKTTFITFDDTMRKQYEDKINITFRMEQALKDREFTVEYQPKIDFDTLRIGGAEALVRWTPPLGAKIFPDEFIPVFEANGFISYLDLYVLEEVCKCIKANHKKMEIPIISVNLSAHTVLADNIVQRVSNIISTHDIAPEKIELELTESAVEANTAIFLERVKQFKKLGFSISIDDFGAGVSSLNRLSAIEADVLKLDKAFFDLKDQGGNSTVVVSDVINMAKHLNMKVVAEGVETGSQALFLKGAGCDYAQGYYFAKPMNMEDFKNLLIEKKLYTISLI